LPNSQRKTVLLLKPRGFCAGVVRAIDVVRIALEAFGPPIYVRKEIVHNSFVVDELRGKGAIFVDSEDEVPNGERVIYSAHGVSPEVREHSARRGLRVIDATCPLVTKVHVEAVKFAKEGYSLILIGHHDHDEVIGTLGEAPLVTQVVGNPEQVKSLAVPDPNRVAYLTQTTLSLDETKDIIAALKKKFPNIKGPAAQDICYATENRQVAVKQVASEADLLLVVGSENSSNSNRLVEVAKPGHELASHRQLQRYRGRLARRCKDDRADRRRFGARVPGRRNHEVSSQQGFRQRAGTRSHAGKRSLRPATGDCRGHRRRSGQRYRGLTEHD
jgi:4-hydroxy-3-methylbut-2-enyl diphosphate reductase